MAPAAMSMPALEQNGCTLFKLPPELRNVIYELVFSSANEMNADGSVYLEKARLPVRDFLVTCQQLHAECRGVHKRACQQYCESVFTNKHDSDCEDVIFTLSKEQQKIMNHATNFRIHRWFFESGPTTRVGIGFDTTWFLSRPTDWRWDARIVVHSTLPQHDPQRVAYYGKRFIKVATRNESPNPSTSDYLLNLLGDDNVLVVRLLGCFRAL